MLRLAQIERGFSYRYFPPVFSSLLFPSGMSHKFLRHPLLSGSMLSSDSDDDAISAGRASKAMKAT
jgi:hypothetical protein